MLKLTGLYRYLVDKLVLLEVEVELLVRLSPFPAFTQEMSLEF